MDRIQPGQQLSVNQQLVSNNGWLSFVVQGDGNLVLYRVQRAQALWASNTVGQAVASFVMQGDGNLVAYTGGGTPIWASNTAGHPGASAILQDDGNFVVYDSGNHPLWATNTVQNFNSPTIEYTDARGYGMNETSESWKQLCSALPCFAGLHWPGYATLVFEETINGEPVVIQLWKGLCPNIFLTSALPGGVGAEVGVYRRVPGRIRPTSIPFLPSNVASSFLAQISSLSDNELWWPAPDLNAELEWLLINPVNNQVFMHPNAEHGYWMPAWMDELSYARYLVDAGGKVPSDPEDYVMEFRVNNKVGTWPGGVSSNTPQGASVAVASRRTDNLDIYVVNQGSTVASAAWEPGFTDGWHGWWPIGNVTFPPGSPVHSVVRSPDHLDIFATASNGVIVTAAWEPGFTDGWHGWWQIRNGMAAPGAAVTAVSRSTDKLDIFVVGTDGRVYTAAWEPGFTDGWHGWWPIGNVTFPPGSPVHSVVRSPDHLDIFATASNGVIVTAAWEPGFTDGWHGWWQIRNGMAAPGAAVTAVSRSTDKLDIFVVGTDGRVYTAAWEPGFTDGWHGWWPIGNVTFPPGSPVHSVVRSPDHLDIFATASNGVIVTAAWEPGFTDGWHGWWQIRNGMAAPGAAVTAVSRSTDKLDIFVVGTDGRVYTAAWEPGFTDGWHGWWPILP